MYNKAKILASQEELLMCIFIHICYMDYFAVKNLNTLLLMTQYSSYKTVK